MSFSIENVEHNVKNLFSGKKKWFIIGGLGLGIVLFLYIRARRNQANQSADVNATGYPNLPADYTGSIGVGGSTGVGVTMDELGQLRDSLNDSIDALSSKVDQNKSATDSAISSAIAGLGSAFNDSLASLQSDFSQQIDHMTKVQPEVSVSPSVSSPTVSTQATPSAQKVTASGPNPAAPGSGTYRSTDGANSYQVDANGNIFKEGRYIEVTNQNKGYIPADVLQASHNAHATNNAK